MCGFLVEYNLRGQSILSKEEFLGLLGKSRHRGPDSQGWFSNGRNLQLGFNRLAILELTEAGKQPMQSHDGRYTLVFNGEIYNHLALRRKLNFSGFKGKSDTETITACLVEWGVVKTMEQLNGMFAIVIYDSLRNEIILVRDFAGIKPLFYGWDGTMLVSASQYDQITSHTSYKNKQVDTEVLKLYLEQHYMPAPFGLFRDTYQVLPGEMIFFQDDGKIVHNRYWELPRESDYPIVDKQEAITHMEEALDVSVKEQLLSDVPLGAFLSGGVDSSLVCSFVKKYDSSINTYTIGSDSKKHDESERAMRFAKALDLQQEIWNLTAKEMLSHWEDAMSCLHEPLADFSILPTYLVSKLAKKDVTVALSGDGGDELFFGYERFWSVGKNIKFHQYPALLRKALYGFDRYATGNKRVNRVLLAQSQNISHQGLHSRFRQEWLHAVAPDLAQVKLPASYSVFDYEHTSDIRTLLGNMRHAEFYGMMQKTLRKVDLASMENSLEIRVPFLNKRVIEASLKIDPLLSYGDGASKVVLKELLNQRIPSVPQEKIKKGFSIPLTTWLREDLKTEFQERLLDSDISNYGFNRSAVASMLNTHFSCKEDLKWPLFTLYALTQFK